MYRVIVDLWNPMNDVHMLDKVDRMKKEISLIDDIVLQKTHSNCCINSVYYFFESGLYKNLLFLVNEMLKLALRVAFV